jgi:GDP-4-dehydro-6-deoxy-D-mannose reductase
VGRRKPRVLITGIAGFGGTHLAEYLRAGGREVIGLDHPAVLKAVGRTTVPAAEILDCDLTRLSPGDLESFVGRSPLEAVYHLAAIASVHLSWGSVQTTVDVNAVGTINLIESLQHLGRPPLLLVGSADQYGAVPPGKQPLREGFPCAPRSPYALSKLWQEELGRYYVRLGDWPIFLTRTFNHTGPGQSPNFVCSDFARQIALIEAGRREPVMRVGNLRAARDFLDVRDVVRAYCLLLEKGRPGTPYNVSSGKSWKISTLLGMLLDLSKVKIRVQQDPSRQRPADIPLLLGHPGRLRRVTGWRPVLQLDQTLADLLEYWREHLRSEG